MVACAKGVGRLAFARLDSRGYRAAVALPMDAEWCMAQSVCALPTLKEP
ncbi:MAG TPA: hypothetical protein VK855_09290 [Thioalkalivibrio sp.]|nr:hypothetical protein [Thioalkalivibrio sp.]